MNESINEDRASESETTSSSSRVDDGEDGIGDEDMCKKGNSSIVGGDEMIGTDDTDDINKNSGGGGVVQREESIKSDQWDFV